MKYIAVNSTTLAFEIFPTVVVEGEVTVVLPKSDSKVKVDGFPAMNEVKVTIVFSTPSTFTHIFTIEGTSNKTVKAISDLSKESYVVVGDSTTETVQFPNPSGTPPTIPTEVTVRVSDAGQDTVKID